MFLISSALPKTFAMVKVPKNIFPKPVSWFGLFFAASYNKTALSNFKKDLEISSNFGGLFRKKELYLDTI